LISNTKDAPDFAKMIAIKKSGWLSALDLSIDAADGTCELSSAGHRRGHGIGLFCDSSPHIL
jgi:hypothetical protein